MGVYHPLEHCGWTGQSCFDGNYLRVVYSFTRGNVVYRTPGLLSMRSKLVIKMIAYLGHSAFNPTPYF